MIAGQEKEGKPVRIIILKARQMGFSTLTEGILFKRTATRFNVESRIVAHTDEATTNLYNMYRLFYEKLPDKMKPQLRASNAKELIFDVPNHGSGVGLKSRVKCNTAGTAGLGRSDMVTNLHISEFAFWPGDKEEAYSSLMQAVPAKPGTMVIIESTANGYEQFKDMWDKAVAGESDYEPVFFAWYEMAEYAMPYDGSKLTDEERELKTAYGLTNEQIAWRRWKIKNDFNGNVDKFRQEFPANPEEAFLMSGTPVFDVQKVAERIAELEKEEVRTGRFLYEWNDPDTEDKIVDYSFGAGTEIRIYREPEEGVPYVIGADTKGQGKDFYAATVLDNSTGERVATLHMQVNEAKPFTHQLYCLGKWYNDALIGVEMNFNLSPIEELQRLHYPKQYVRREYDSYKKNVKEQYGWKMDGNTRPLIIDKEASVVTEHIELFHDVPTLREMMTFQYDDKGRPDAMAGYHDDLLFSDMIANEIREQQSFARTVMKDGKKTEWADDMFEDYYSADEAGKKRLLKLWGEPKKWR